MFDGKKSVSGCRVELGAVLMKISWLGRYVLGSCVTVVLLAGCGATPTPMGVPGVTLQGTQPRFEPPGGPAGAASWMLPDAKAQDLLYVGNVFTVSVYSYPLGKLEGRLTGFLASSGECVDAKGDVFITSEVGETIVEYAHGGTKPIETLLAAAEHPLGCAIDPTTGNLAVTTFGNNSAGNLAIYPHAMGGPSTYTDPHILQYYLCGYDKNGNLFVDGISPPRDGSHFVLAELPKGSSTFTDITLDKHISLPGGVQWDGKYLALADQNTSVIYQFRLSGSRGTEVHSTPLGSPASDVFQFYISGKTVIAPNDYSLGSKTTKGDVLYYQYPAGGAPIRTITHGVHEPRGVVLSKANT
jgi:hypothetical protein